jgi:hypothetical protein
MIQNGLIKEVLDFHSQHAATSSSGEGSVFPDETVESSGVNIAIGYKELLPYILEVERQKKQSLDTGGRDSNQQEQLETLLNACVERVSLISSSLVRHNCVHS